MNDTEEICNTLGHDDLIEITNSAIGALIVSNSLLSDLPSDIILEEIFSQIAVEHGQSITVFISRDTEPVLKISQSSTVLNLKKAIARHFEIYQKRIGNNIKISWKYIWKTYDLSYDGLILDNNSSRIEDYGVCNKVTLQFKKRRKKKR